MPGMQQLRVVELFAGVGGFRVGLERASPLFKTIWSNQWEPATRRQWASEVYRARFGEQGHCNANIATVPANEIPEHDLLVGGFPCQDYSVARTLDKAGGLTGKKGVLWWEIHRILAHQERPPLFVLLENVDRLLSSPARQRGRDFAVMLASLADLGYVVEWRVINAADYGMPQRRRRTFFLCYHKSSSFGAAVPQGGHPEKWMLHQGIMVQAFPIAAPKDVLGAMERFDLVGDLAVVSETFNRGRTSSASPFRNAGIMVERRVCTAKVMPDHQGPCATLADVLQPDNLVPETFFLADSDLPKWAYLKGAKNEERTHKTSGSPYRYSEGPMAFPDPTHRPSRTIITAEGGSGPSRFKHVVRTRTGRLRRLTPVELERLNMFPDDHTVGASDSRRAFFMGNALVVGVVERVAAVLASHYLADPTHTQAPAVSALAK
jgi:DNA (cytosine-5)-methyltransferase 1